MEHWIFVVEDHIVGGKTIPFTEILNTRVRERFWLLSRRAAKIRRLQKGDQAIFYATGS